MLITSTSTSTSSIIASTSSIIASTFATAISSSAFFTQIRKLQLHAAFALVIFVFSTMAHASEPLSIDMKDLGFDKSSILSNPAEAQLLEQRAKQLQRHQFMGYTTAALVAATVFAAPEDGQKASLVHRGLAVAALSSYAYTAYLSLSAPEIEGAKKLGLGTKIHKSMVWIHLPIMTLLPFAGLSAQQARERGQEPSGLGKFHGTFGQIALASLLVSAVSMTIEF